MRKMRMTSGLVALAVVACATVAFAQEKAFTENANVLYRTNITLTSTAPVALGVGLGGNVRVVEWMPSGGLARVRVYPSTSSTASSTVTNDLSNAKGTFTIGGTNQSYTMFAPMNVKFGRSTDNGYWSKYLYIASPDGTGTVSYVELGR